MCRRRVECVDENEYQQFNLRFFLAGGGEGCVFFNYCASFGMFTGWRDDIHAQVKLDTGVRSDHKITTALVTSNIVSRKACPTAGAETHPMGCLCFVLALYCAIIFIVSISCFCSILFLDVLWCFLMCFDVLSYRLLACCSLHFHPLFVCLFVCLLVGLLQGYMFFILNLTYRDL